MLAHHVHGSTIHSRQKVDKPQMSTDGQMDKQNSVYTQAQTQAHGDVTQPWKGVKLWCTLSCAQALKTFSYTQKKNKRMEKDKNRIILFGVMKKFWA